MVATRNGVYHTLSESPWRCRDGDVTYFFATKGHYDAFCSRLVPAQTKMSMELSRRVGVQVDMSAAAAMQLYRRVETYGFHVEVGGVAVTAPEGVAIGPGALGVL